ncbi:MAG TPA: hypothetical protein DCO80_02240 [Ornithinibacillus sp.]|nr:hypothetical protein [Ornithinibacillus sp.]
MKQIIVRKIIAGLITVFNIGFIFILMDPNITNGTSGNLFLELLDLLLVIIVFSVICISPFVLVGVLFSVLIDRIRIQSKVKNLLYIIGHLLLGLIIGILAIIIFQLDDDYLDLNRLTNKFFLIRFLFICFYPTIIFCLLDMLYKKTQKVQQ